ncbi:lasso RiPP family leader peptide-containing protein [Jatrophihabitans telluris]|uniref:lasso RiPP family leader peptide-containing protein n=1 Tax=Jatrophihabitans telluris TaxID=2038343 RepID=UPI003D31A5BA
MHEYNKPAITELGSFADLTLSSITKTAGTGDVIVINGESVSVPGAGVVSVS